MITSTDSLTDKYIYINKEEGWKLTSEATGMFKQNCTLYHTTNGGTAWTEVTGTNDEEYSIPSETFSGIIFIDDKNGWITLDVPKQGYIGLYSTTDGGYTWTENQISVPEEYINAMFKVYAPVFFTSTDGLLLTYQYDIEDQLVFATHDGGITWISVSESDDDSFKWDCLIDSEAANSGWIVEFDNKAWRTTDAVTWEQTK